MSGGGGGGGGYNLQPLAVQSIILEYEGVG